MDIFSLLAVAKEKKASDLHLVAYRPPQLRVHGLLEGAPDIPPLTPGDIVEFLAQITTEKERARFQERMELDFAYSVPGVGRVRGNAARQRGTTSLVFRLLPQAIGSIEELGLPEVCQELIMRPRGLVVVSGPTGSGKSTTLAAMLNYLNHTTPRRVVTIEDPIEYLYEDVKCVITQRELGSDTHSFAEALRHVLRQNPDIILVGEMRDLETAAAALTLAETGHLVLATGHAPSAPQCIERVTDLFPPPERPLAQSRLASLLVGVLCQVLVPKTDGSGRVVAVEVMLANASVRNLIRDGKIFQLPNAMRTHARSGMQLLDVSLAQLYRKGAITHDSLMAFCNDPEEITRLTGKLETIEAPV